MWDADSKFPGSAVTDGGFVFGLFEKLKSLRVPAHQSRHTDVAPVCVLDSTLQKLTRYRVFADIGYKRFIEGSIVALHESPAVLEEVLDDGNVSCISQHEHHHDSRKTNKFE